MALNVEAVTPVAFSLGMPKVVETGTEHVGQRGKRANMPAEVTTVFGVVTVGLDHHGHGVPAHVGAQAFFNFDVAWATLFLVYPNGVDVTGGGRKRHVEIAFARMRQQFLK